MVWIKVTEEWSSATDQVCLWEGCDKWLSGTRSCRWTPKGERVNVPAEGAWLGRLNHFERAVAARSVWDMRSNGSDHMDMHGILLSAPMG